LSFPARGLMPDARLGRKGRFEHMNRLTAAGFLAIAMARNAFAEEPGTVIQLSGAFLLLLAVAAALGVVRLTRKRS